MYYKCFDSPYSEAKTSACKWTKRCPSLVFIKESIFWVGVDLANGLDQNLPSLIAINMRSRFAPRSFCASLLAHGPLSLICRTCLKQIFFFFLSFIIIENQGLLDICSSV